MIDCLKENIFEVTDQMLSDLLSLSSSRESNLYYIQNVKIIQASMEKEMRDYERERSLVKEREGIEFAADVREAAQTSVFKSLDMVDRNPLQVSFFLAQHACMHVF